MLDPTVVEQLVKEQISNLVTDQVIETLASEDWLKPIEQRIIQYTQERILVKFANATAMPEIIQAVKDSVTDLFVSGKIPELAQYVSQESIKNAVDQAVAKTIQNNINELSRDAQWLDRIEQLINQAVAYQTIAKLGSIDINTIINQRVDENVDRFLEKLRENFSTKGIVDQATETQLTVMDEATVFENDLVANNLEVANGAVINHLVVKGSINTDNTSWDDLATSIKERTLKQFVTEFQEKMIQDVAVFIKNSGIDSSQIRFGGQVLAEDNRLSSSITDTNIQKVGILRNLTVASTTNLNETVTVHRKRVGINTEEPEMALSIWDEEVSLNIGKTKLNQAYIGTGRAQGISIGTNRVGHIDITADGLTQIKKLQVGLHKIGHASEVPGWSGTKGDIIFNSSPGNDRVFAWVCLGAYKWQPLKSSE